ncbi:MAG: type I 3-dehydroquinate dehydratase [Nitrosopumilus sp.]|uniref:3-dehydroquinate dehydratase n=2 Tax=Marine Group I thaumarchaeote TaxID=2511932 RepID=A0A7K4NIB8_9ARCH|nr:MAG: type I 3-dehydroquinate dehydratase [Nitrosopumilus sp. YT1]NMI81607.1 type I 3-dehydroquinate dehydratase [Candidatus Nitrosopumilus sp. MTA1]NWJ19542.1 type I 3-dehydroquinate dehydratase [Marine Group I thaumarchaeote]NWJ56889.1 type I 3-dehydroquinate dehydratase [Marine Group I thaumarchaeote]NWJ83892.1 type I 3-dehydroquinate dehydratase [Marine Group I thaumarchaeote]
MKYKTCVSIAEKTPYKIKQILKIALKKSDYAEVRFDFLKIEQIPEALETIKKDLKKIVCTLRPKTEGGKFPGNEKERIAILKLIAEYNPFLLDVEFNTLKRNSSLVRYLKSTKTKLLVSWHDFKKTPSSAELKKKMNQMTKFSFNVKIVSTAKSTNDSSRMLELYSKKGRNNLISFAMGDLGRISRILCLYLGSPFTYVSLGNPVAPGQFSVDEVKKITNLKK